MQQRESMSLGDLVAAAFDVAGRVTKDAQQTSMLAAFAIRKLLVKAGRVDLARRLAEQAG